MGEKILKNHALNSKMLRKDSQVKSSPFDKLKWVVVLLLIIGGITANTYFASVAWAIRAAIGIVVVLVAMAVAMQTATGQLIFGFAKGAKIEMRKVVWPTRQETVQTTLVVVAMVAFSALVLWGMDTLFFWLVGWLAGQRG